MFNISLFLQSNPNSSFNYLKSKKLPCQLFYIIYLNLHKKLKLCCYILFYVQVLNESTFIKIMNKLIKYKSSSQELETCVSSVVSQLMEYHNIVYKHFSFKLNFI